MRVCGACWRPAGLDPLYAQKTTQQPLVFQRQVRQLHCYGRNGADFKVEPIADRFGQQVRNQLLDLLTPQGSAQEAEIPFVCGRRRDRQVTQQALRQGYYAANSANAYAMQGYSIGMEAGW